MDNLLIKNELDIKCALLKKLLENETACDRYIKQSHVVIKLEDNKSSNYKDIRGIERYVY